MRSAHVRGIYNYIEPENDVLHKPQHPPELRLVKLEHILKDALVFIPFRLPVIPSNAMTPA
jgi:hypothetical protein